MLVWFRNDLRVHDNPALLYALNNGAKRCVFFTTDAQWHQHDLAPIKADFMWRHVQALREQLAQYGLLLDIIAVADYKAQLIELMSYCKKHDISEVVANKELEFNERLRDESLQISGFKLTLFEADVIVAKGVVLNKSEQMYKVFTPFRNAWIRYVIEHGFVYIDKSQFSAFSNPSLSSEIKYTPTDMTYPRVDSSHWPLAHEVEQQVIPSFLQEKIDQYQQNRDIPGIKGTSGLSPYLAIGAISPRYLLTLLINSFPDILLGQPSSAFTWLNELIWREFYRHLMFQFPALCKSKNFNDKYDSLPWVNEQQHLIAWQQGKTGYPIIDAAMRQLNQTGWMHNRLRMVVASFLTKHLLIDWRLGEKYFMQHLIDGDLAANNGGWQWASGTGCDAQPYFRVFNPILQSKRFDPEGVFIRKYLPELQDIPNKHIHFPHDYLEKVENSHYWPAIVDHKEARLRAISFYKTNS